MKLLELLKEYMILQHNKDKRIKLTGDLALGDFQLARFSETYCEVIFLTTGESLRLEKELIRLLYGFYRSRAEEIVRAEDVIGSDLWELIIICSRIMTGNSIDPGKLKNTEKFRSWIKDNFNISYGPLIYNSRDNTIML